MQLTFDDMETMITHRFKDGCQPPLQKALASIPLVCSFFSLLRSRFIIIKHSIGGPVDCSTPQSPRTAINHGFLHIISKAGH